MGQAWCKERTTKAQDSKSPLDRVFVRCAHQIYPTLKQDGSVLGGATQRVTSSEIGYAGSPSRDALTRGQSVDSIDRPFHPSEWIDVNLEVPSTPSSVITNLTANTNLYPTTTTTMSSTDNRRTSSGSNVKNKTPVPPPRKRRKNRGRPLPPKPDEIVDKTKPNNKKIEPLYSSVKSQKIREAELQAIIEQTKKQNDKEIHEHKVNGTGKIVAITNVKYEDRRSEIPRDRTEGDSRQQNERNNTNNNNNNNNNSNNNNVVVAEEKTNNQDIDYEKFSKSHNLGVSSSTPNGPAAAAARAKAKNSERGTSSGKDLREFVSRTIMEEDDDIVREVVHNRQKNYSTVSLPNYDELEVVKKEVEREDNTDDDEAEILSPKKPGRARNISTISLPATELLELPKKTSERLEKYMKRCRSFGSLQPQEILDKINAHGEQIESSDEDEWGGLDDWDLGVVEYNEPRDGRSPLVPSSQLTERKGSAQPKFLIGEVVDADKPKARDLKIDVTQNLDSPVKIEAQNNVAVEKSLTIPRNASFEIPKSPNSLKSALKVEANRKISMPARLSSDDPSSPLEDWFSAQERSVRFFDVPKLEEEYANTPGHRPVKPSPAIVRKPEEEYDTKSYPFNGVITDPLNIDRFFGEAENSGGATKSGEKNPQVSENRPKILTRSLSNESEPFDGYEEKELTLEIRSQPSSSIGKLSRTISDESIPADMEITEVEESLNEEKLIKVDKVDKDSKTPPPSPEPKIKPEIIVDVEQISLGRKNNLKIQKEEEGESNLSSMTPSLTELEAALSDMLEKEDHEEQVLVDVERDVEDSEEDSNPKHSSSGIVKNDDKPIEPKILPKQLIVEEDKNLKSSDLKPAESNLYVRRRKEHIKVSLGQILNSSDKADGGSRKSVGEEAGENVVTRGKNPFEDTDDEDEDEEKEDLADNESKKKSDTFEAIKTGNTPLNPFDSEPPEKPSRLHKVQQIDGAVTNSGIKTDVPRPPQRKNKQGAATSPTSKNYADYDDDDVQDTEFPIKDSTPHPNDRLI